jgi:hypothetical protein
MANSKNPAPVPPAAAKPDDGYVSENIGFPPYYNPIIGHAVDCVADSIDASDPEFVRLQFVLAQPKLLCHRGAKDPKDGSAEEVVVTEGEVFSMSDYHQIRQFVAFALTCPFPVPMRIVVKDKIKIDGGKTLWQFDVRTPKSVHEQLQGEKRRRAQTRLAEAQKPAAELPAPAAS